jgi:hypothetical protein
MKSKRHHREASDVTSKRQHRETSDVNFKRQHAWEKLVEMTSNVHIMGTTMWTVNIDVHFENVMRTLNVDAKNVVATQRKHRHDKPPLTQTARHNDYMWKNSTHIWTLQNM